jgi:hypothetical protein
MSLLTPATPDPRKALIAHAKSKSQEPSPAEAQSLEEETPASEQAATALGDLLDQALTQEIVIIEKIERVILPADITSIAASLAATYTCTPQVAIVGLFSTLQAGGTSRNKKSNVRITVQGKTFESKVVNKAISTRRKDITPRQFARFFATEIYKCSSHFQITGNAYTYITRSAPHKLTQATPEEKYWAADFQIDNPACPQNIREALKTRYDEKFIRTTKKIN